MRLEQTSGALRTVGDRLFRLIEEMAGVPPESPKSRSDQWYKAMSKGTAFLFLRFIGKRARKNPPNSVLLNAKWDDWMTDPRILKGDNLYYKASADVVVRPDDSEEVALAEQFVRRAFELHR